MLFFGSYRAFGYVRRPVMAHHLRADACATLYLTTLEAAEAGRRVGRRVLLTAQQLPALPKIGWVYGSYTDTDLARAIREGHAVKIWQKIGVTVPGLEVSGQVPGFGLAPTNLKKPDGYYSAPWAATADDAANLFLVTDLHWFMSPGGYSPDQNRAYLYRPRLIPAAQAPAIRQRLHALEQPMLYGFFDHAMTDPAYFPDKTHTMTGHWARYVRRIVFTPKATFSGLIDVPSSLQSLAPQIRAVWLELFIRVDERGKLLKRSPPFAKIIAFETKQGLYLVEQHPIRQRQQESGVRGGVKKVGGIIVSGEDVLKAIDFSDK